MNDDLQAIRNLCYAYTFALDEGDFAAVGLLLEDATLRPVMPGVGDEGVRGRAAVERFYRDQVVTYSRGRPMTRHLITNHAIEVDEDDTARSRCYFTVLQRPPGLPYQIVVGGRYDDRFAKRDGAWRFTERAIHVDHLNEIGHHFRIADADRAQP
jgi:SnoaL-like domain